MTRIATLEFWGYRADDLIRTAIVHKMARDRSSSVREFLLLLDCLI